MNSLNIFFVYSILGHLFEKIFNPNGTSGILYGYWTPVYGIGTLIIIFSYTLFEKRFKLSFFWKLIATFLIGFVLLSFLEFLGGTLIEKIFHVTFWDYSKMRFHIGKYASLEMGLLWGVASIFVLFVVHPLLQNLLLKIPKWLTYSFCFLFLLDLTATIFLKAK